MSVTLDVLRFSIDIAVDFQRAFAGRGRAGDLDLSAIVKDVVCAGQFQTEPPFEFAD